MKFGLVIDRFWFPDGPKSIRTTLLSMAKNAENSGFDSIWIPDHFLNEGEPIGPDITDREMLECFTTLGFIAAATSTIKIGPLVTGVTYRYPSILIKQMTTLDVLSGGRVYFSVGAAWFQEEHKAYGIPFPDIKNRFAMLEETIQIAIQMWSDNGKYNDAQEFIGKYYNLDRTLNVPQSLQRPHPPILIGGNGEKITLRLVAQYGDACNFVGPLSYEDIKRKLEVLRHHCESFGRSFESIEKTYYLYPFDVSEITRPGTFSAAGAIEHLSKLRDIGIDTVMIDNVQIDFSNSKTFDFWAADIIPFV